MNDPRQVGGVYRSSYWALDYTVSAIERDRDGWLRSITVEWHDGWHRTTTHCTAWNKRDRILQQPTRETSA